MASFLGIKFSRESYLSYLGLISSLQKLQVVILKINLRHLNQLHIASNSTIIPPVENLGGHILCVAFIVHLYYYSILTLLQQIAYVVVEWCKTTYMVACLLAIDPNMTIVVDCTKIQQGAIILHRYCIETFLEPYSSFVEEQSLILRVPIRWNLHRRRFVEIVLYQVFWFLGLSITEKTPSGWVHTIIVITLFLYVNDVVPLAIKRATLVGIYILNQRYFIC